MNIDNAILSDKIKINRRNIYIISSILIGLILISPKDVTWANDRESYINYALYSYDIVNRYISTGGIITLLSNEPLFLMINIILSSFFSPESIIKIIIFVSTTGVLVSLGKLTKYNFLVLFFFLFVPQILKNHVTHIRQGLALCLYLIGLTSNKKYNKIIKCSSIFIHTSFVFVIVFELLEWSLKKLKLNFRTRLVISSIFFLIIILSIPQIARILGDRRALEYSFSFAEGSSGYGFLLWWVVSIGYILLCNKDNNINIISCYGIIFYLLSYFFLDFVARIFENIVPLILAGTLNDERKEIRYLFIVFFLFYGLITWYFQRGTIF